MLTPLIIPHMIQIQPIMQLVHISGFAHKLKLFLQKIVERHVFTVHDLFLFLLVFQFVLEFFDFLN